MPRGEDTDRVLKAAFAVTIVAGDDGRVRGQPRLPVSRPRMLVIARLHDLPPVKELAVIINCGTKWVSTLALASALRHAAMPVLMIDCESGDGSEAHFAGLARKHGFTFFWLSWPLRPHPDALDQLFAEIPAKFVLLVDSDVEIRTSAVIETMRAALAAHADAYGSGFLQRGEWLGPPQHLLPARTGYYAERMWIPLTLLRTSVVRDAFLAGSCFAARRPFFEIGGHPRISRLLGYRFRVPGLRYLRLPRSANGAASAVDGVRPAFIDYDTGADLHHFLVAGGHSYCALPDTLWGDVHHYHGVTRARIGGTFRHLAGLLGLVSRQSQAAPSVAHLDAVARLREGYAIAVP